jgi:hypothetical protein
MPGISLHLYWPPRQGSWIRSIREMMDQKKKSLNHEVAGSISGCVDNSGSTSHMCSNVKQLERVEGERN